MIAILKRFHGLFSFCPAIILLTEWTMYFNCFKRFRYMMYAVINATHTHIYIYIYIERERDWDD